MAGSNRNSAAVVGDGAWFQPILAAESPSFEGAGVRSPGSEDVEKRELQCIAGSGRTDCAGHVAKYNGMATRNHGVTMPRTRISDRAGMLPHHPNWAKEVIKELLFSGDLAQGPHRRGGRSSMTEIGSGSEAGLTDSARRRRSQGVQQCRQMKVLILDIARPKFYEE